MEKTFTVQHSNFEDELVKLTPLQSADFEVLYQVASDPLIWEQHPANDRYKREIFQSYFEGAMASGTAFLIIEKSSGNIIGCTRYYDYKPEQSGIAIGFTFLIRRCWGGTYNWSVKKLLLDYAFLFVEEVYFHIGSTNIRSQLGTSKIGASKINEVYLDHNGVPLLHFEYLLRKEDWEKQAV